MTLKVKQHRMVLVDEDGAPCGIVDGIDAARAVVESNAHRWDHVAAFHLDVPHFEEVEAP